MTKPFYITTPLYYVNAKPHIGHAYTNILCDTFARWRRLIGEEVFFMTGTDEHGTKIDKAARDQGKAPKVYADEMVPEFKKLWELLGIQYDYFIRTTDSNHKTVVQNVLRDLEKKGDIYKGKYTGWYCTPCESFWTRLQLLEGKCPDCKREVQELSEDNYFFKLSKYQKWLIEYIEASSTFIRPEIRKNEILGFLREPLEDLCITRPRIRLAWGIDYPGSKDHVVYVWFDALINYISGVDYSVDDKKFKKYWPADVHMVGKDILRHHAVYWPIMLKAVGVEMPKTVLAHGWWTMSGAKVSKSRGNAVDPIELCKKYGVDAFRYFLLREVTLGLDGAFSEDLLAERYTSDLANDLGNLWFRIAAMLQKYTEGKIPAYQYEPEILKASHELNPFKRTSEFMASHDPARALNAILNVIVLANQKIEIEKPWELAKDKTKKEKLANVLGNLAEQIAHVSVLLLPFLPETAGKILRRLKLPTEWIIKDEKEFEKPLLKAGISVEKGDALFPRLDEEKVS
ncbi:MAG: methionine--tRNA ligase [Omnitrophica bacterium RIFCSPHIGHO2_02_FULL_46_11]|nr:MAG: methionine--tRNA ligase [Omnitrophica bacterium RIFCSPLOWO2_01_FULL_45_10b]OGW87729.1 MAG: methionine--tRNA ligase [Omnitrophica bacterium RIFCSPHIGHO2_02_FULL_46_11]